MRLQPLARRDASEAEQKAEIKQVFRRLGDFAQAIKAKAMDRFPDLAEYEHFSSLLEDAATDLTLPVHHVEGLAKFYQVPDAAFAEFLGGWRRLWAERAAVLKRDTVAGSNLWLFVLGRCNSGTAAGADARTPVLAWILFQSQSCSCERVFSLATELSKRLGHHSSLTFEPYLMARLNGGQPQQENTLCWLHNLANELVSQDVRFTAAQDNFYIRKSKMVQRKRAERCDRGQKRKTYKFIKRKGRLSTAKSLHGLSEGRFVATSDSRAECPDIMAVHSPLQRKQAD